jgi:hypothetical protein
MRAAEAQSPDKHEVTLYGAEQNGKKGNEKDLAK